MCFSKLYKPDVPAPNQGRIKALYQLSLAKYYEYTQKAQGRTSPRAGIMPGYLFDKNV
jgi:hypothetical protein